MAVPSQPATFGGMTTAFSVAMLPHRLVESIKGQYSAGQPMARERGDRETTGKKNGKALPKAAGTRRGKTTTSISGAPDKLSQKQAKRAADLQQDPHHVSGKGRSLETAIGREVRNFRHQLNMTVA